MTYEEYRTVQLLKQPNCISPIPWLLCGLDNIAISLQMYFDKGIPPGSFTKALICGHVDAALHKADPWSFECLGSLWWMVRCLPRECLDENYDNWIENSGIIGFPELRYDWDSIGERCIAKNRLAGQSGDRGRYLQSIDHGLLCS